MRKVSLKDIAFVKAGNSAPSKDEFSESGVPFIRAGSLEFLVKGDGVEKCEKVDLEIAKKKKLKLYPKGSILFAKSGMSSKLGRIYMLPSDAYVVSHLAIITVFDEKVIGDYVKYYFQFRPPYHLIRDDAYPSIKLSDIENIELDIPDIETQHQIVSALDKAQDLIDKRQKSIELMDELLRATFLEMFGEPFINSKNWENIKVDDVVTKIESGWSVAGQRRQKENDEFGVLKVSAVTSGRYKPKEHKAVDKIKIKKKLIIPEIGDVLFSRANTIDLVAACCIVDHFDANIFLPDKLWKVNLDNLKVTREYFLMVMQSENYRKNLALMSTGSSGSMLNISQKKFLSYQFPLAPIEIQKEYSNYFLKISDLRNKLISGLEKSSNLFQALLQRAFHGDLLVDTDLQLDTFLESEDHSAIARDEVLIQRLVDRFNSHNEIKIEQEKAENGFSFESLEIYEKAKETIFHLLKEGLARQNYDESSNKTKLEAV